jgi:membrane protein YqaA with SNARE-associated domain
MKLFSYIYVRMMSWSEHPHARYYLAGVSFAESSFFPIPPDVMLISMGLARPTRAWHYAWIATLFSVIGGCFGYLIGYYGMELIEPYLLASSYAASYEHIQHWFEQSGLWMVVFAGFSPFPYKLFTLTAGAMHMGFFFPFVMGSLLGRGLRFFLVSGVLFFAGARLETRIRRFIDLIGWVVLSLLVLGYVVVKWLL